MKKDDYAGVPWPVATRRISQAWKQLDAQGKARYQQISKQEINAHHEAMVEHGLRKQADGVSAEEYGGHGGVAPFDAQTVQYSPEGMTWLHTYQIAHLDLKPGN